MNPFGARPLRAGLRIRLQLNALHARLPETLFLLADDLRVDGVGYATKDVRMPYLDRSAAEGVRFRNMLFATDWPGSGLRSMARRRYRRLNGSIELRLTTSI